MAPYQVILLPGSMLPGDLAYGSLVAALGSASDAVVKELEVYATPAWAGRLDLSPPEQSLWLEYDQLAALPSDQFMRAFMRLNVKRGVELPSPSPGDPPPWMAKRPGGIRAFMQTFRTYELDLDALGRFDRPVYFALGGLSNPDHYREIATRLSRVFPDFELEVFDERHHFDPPHRSNPSGSHTH
jgi:hypothetical protein